MAIAVPELPGGEIDVQPYFLLKSTPGDLLLNEDGSFYEKTSAGFSKRLRLSH